MKHINLFKPLLIASLFLGALSCTNEPVVTNPPAQTNYFVGIVSATTPAVDVLSNADSLDGGTISPIDNGFEQIGWSVFIQGVDQIFSYAYSTAPEYTSYALENGTLQKGSNFFTDLSAYAINVVDEANMVVVGNARSGLTDKKIYLINTNTMTIEKTVTSNFGDIAGDSLFAFPADIEVRGDKLFAAYYHVHARGDFSTPEANTAYLAVFNYPELTLEKIISDNRAPNLGRYLTTNALEEDENGDIYTFASSSRACGFVPVPSKNSAILRVKNGETEFDPTYYIDFETLSGGYKINDLIYSANGKAVVRVVKEDENDAAYTWATYSPNSAHPIIETGIVDLYNQTFKLLPEVPKGGGGWNSAFMVEDGKVYLGVSSSEFASIYIIDTEAGTAKKGADIDGNYAKAILSLKE